MDHVAPRSAIFTLPFKGRARGGDGFSCTASRFSLPRLQGLVDTRMRHFVNPQRAMLVNVTRRIDDVLLTPPCIASIKRAWPDAAIAVLVLAGPECVLAANPDIRRFITTAARPH